MFRWNHEYIPSFLSQVGPGDSSGGDASPSGGGGSSSASASGAGPSAPSSGSTPSSAAPTTGSPPSSPSTETPPAGASESPGGGDSMDFEAVWGASSDPDPLETPLAPAPKPVAAKPPVAPEAPAPAAPAKAAEPGAAAPPAPTTPASTEPSAPALDPSDPASIAAHLATNKDAAIAHIAEKLFKLSPEDVEALESDTVGTIPKLLARSFVELQGVMLNQMARLVPQMIQRQTEAIRKNTEAEDAFYSMWPTIDKATHGDLVKRYAVTYRQMHPQATREQMFGDIGPIVMMAAKIPLTAPVAAGAKAAPLAPSPKAKPFVPAGGAPPAGTNNTTVELTPIEAMFAGQDG